jgi:enoyl-CoA hydratase/carnithine racemase
MSNILEYHVDEANIGFLYLNSPPSNEMTNRFFEELVYLTENVIKPDEVRAIIITGRGRHFSSGANLDQLISKIKDNIVLDEKGNIEKCPACLTEEHKAFYFFDNLKIPVIAAITGVCIGSGLELALCAHFRICGEGSVLGLPETSFGLMPGCGGIFFMPGLAGQGKALEIILTGETFSAQEALEWGVVDKVVPKKEVVSFAAEIALKISGNYIRGNVKI